MVNQGRGAPSGSSRHVKKVFFKNATYETTKGYLMKQFRQSGKVENLELWTLPDGRSKGMGVVEFSSTEEAQQAVADLHHAEVDGRPIYVELEDPDRMGKGESKGSSKGGGGGGSSDARRVFFKNVLFETSAGFLSSIFKKFGNVVELNLWVNAEGRSKGMGIVEFRTAREAQTAALELDQAEVDGRPMRVELEDPSRAPIGGKGDDMGSDRGSAKGSSKGGKGKGKCRIFFRNILFETSAGFLLGLFKKFGYVVELNLWKDEVGRSRGCGSVEYNYDSEAKTAIQELHGAEVDGRPIIVEYEDENKGGGKGSFRNDVPEPGGKSWGRGAGGPSRVFFKNLLFETPAGFMHSLFKKFGHVTEFDLWKGADGRSKGMGTVEFNSHREAREAVEQLNGAEVDGRVVDVNFDDPARQEGGKSSGKGSGGKSSSSSGTCKVFFKNLLFETPEDFMKGLFKKFGFIESFRMLKHIDGSPKGMGVVEYRSPNQAKDAVAGLHGAEVDGRIIIVELEDPDRARYDKGEGKGKGDGKGGAKRVFFKNCLFETTANYLLKKFSQYGTVIHLDLWVNEAGQSRGCGTVEFRTNGEARECARLMSGTDVDGRPIGVDMERATGSDVATYMPMRESKGKSRGKPY